MTKCNCVQLYLESIPKGYSKVFQMCPYVGIFNFWWGSFAWRLNNSSVTFNVRKNIFLKSLKGTFLGFIRMSKSLFDKK